MRRNRFSGVLSMHLQLPAEVFCMFLPNSAPPIPESSGQRPTSMAYPFKSALLNPYGPQDRFTLILDNISMRILGLP